jgi:NADPH-dependent glutamate synthase beta subunit-like oxidoreductase
MSSHEIPACWATCPLTQRSHAYIALIAEQKYERALNLIRRDNPLPGVTGRVCHHPCESACERRKIDDPLAISYLKRFVADYERKTNPKMPSTVKKTKEKKVAIVGSGPAGLTAAYHLNLKGYEVTIFEAFTVLGGMLIKGIPSFRLAREVIQYEIDRIQSLGVTMKTGICIGQDISFETLFERGYEAIFIAIGASKSLKLRIPGENEFRGIVDCLEFLQRVNLGDRKRPGDKVCIIGGGNAAVDCARTALRLGCENVTIVYRRSRKEMPAIPTEIEEAEAEGVKIFYLVSPVRILGEKGHVTGMECLRMKLGEPDASGRRRPIPIKGTEFIITADTIISAISQRPDLSFLSEEHGFTITRWNTFEVDPETLQTNKKGVFAGGDAVTGPATVIEAIAAGKKGAEMIDRYLRGVKLKNGKMKRTRKVRLTIEEVKSFEKRLRQRMPKLTLEARERNFHEVELGFDEETAVKEARRCLRCWFPEGFRGTLK